MEEETGGARGEPRLRGLASRRVRGHFERHGHVFELRLGPTHTAPPRIPLARHGLSPACGLEAGSAIVAERRLMTASVSGQPVGVSPEVFEFGKVVVGRLNLQPSATSPSDRERGKWPAR